MPTAETGIVTIGWNGVADRSDGDDRRGGGGDDGWHNDRQGIGGMTRDSGPPTMQGRTAQTIIG